MAVGGELVKWLPDDLLPECFPLGQGRLWDRWDRQRDTERAAATVLPQGERAGQILSTKSTWSTVSTVSTVHPQSSGDHGVAARIWAR